MMTEREEKIARLTNQQALSIVDSLAGEFAGADMPEHKEDRAQALQALFQQYGDSVAVTQVTLETDEEVAAQAARQLLRVMAQEPIIMPSLDEWLEQPPSQETAAIPLILAAPVVLTGCIAFLYVVGHVHVERKPDGKWEWKYDPAQKTPMDENMKQIVQTLANVMNIFHPQP